MHREREPICKEVQNVPNVPDEIDPELNLPMKKFSIAFTLPVSLKQCRQSNEHDPWIRFNHLVHYRIIIKNPDGHTSEVSDSSRSAPRAAIVRCVEAILKDFASNLPCLHTKSPITD